MSRKWLLVAVFAALGVVPAANAQTASCRINYTWPTWVGGNGFGASIDITNTGPAITNGWSLVFNFPNGQQLQNGWPVTVTQSGTTMTFASNADWNKAIATGATFTPDGHRGGAATILVEAEGTSVKVAVAVRIHGVRFTGGVPASASTWLAPGNDVSSARSGCGWRRAATRTASVNSAALS